MFSIFDKAQYELEVIGQKKHYEDEYDYVGESTTVRSICVYTTDAERDETIPLSNMAELSFNVPCYLLEYWTDDSMVVLTDVSFIELEFQYCCFESTIDGVSRVYRISKGEFTKTWVEGSDPPH